MWDTHMWVLYSNRDIYGAVQGVIQTLTPLVTGEVSSISGLKDDVSSITDELLTISVFLKNAEERTEGDNVAKEWVRQVRMLAYGIEDAIDRYQLFLKKNVLGKAKQYVLMDVSDIASTIKGLHKTTLDIARRRCYIPTAESSGKCTPASTQTITVNDNIEIVDDDIAKAEITNLVISSTTLSTTMAVVGMRGIEKTTVISSVYGDKTVISRFNHRAWISMSQTKGHSDILRSIILQFNEVNKLVNIDEVYSMDKGSLLHLLQKLLNYIRCIIVFDDFQEGDIELAAYIKGALHLNYKGSKLIMITRYENLARAWLDGSTIGMYKLKPLPFEKSWELFCKRTFQSFGGNCPSSLNDLARRIVKKCGGFPPAIVCIGRLLSTKEHDVNEWNKVRHGLGFYLVTNRHLIDIHKTFLHGYYDLPFYLKPCFLYFGLFPKGHQISQMKLIRLWLAEGFIRESRGNLSLEEIAEEYIRELIDMSMIDVKSTDVSGKVRSVGLVNNFLYEIILTKLDELSFCKILSKKDCGGNELCRRLSIHMNHDSNAPEFLKNVTKIKSSIRTLILLDSAPEILANVFNRAFLKSIYLLKVLDLSDAQIDDMPKEVGKLLHLSYLSLRSTRVSKLPRSIRKLENIQTLDLKQARVSVLPVEIIQLQKLRHLLGYYYEYDFSYSVHCMKTTGIKIPKGLLGRCSELQKLAVWDINGHKNWALELINLTKLRKLGIRGLKHDEGKTLCSLINTMKYLQTLNIFSENKSEIIDLRYFTSPPIMLKRLYLSGPLPSNPIWIEKLHGLVRIRLRWSNLTNDPFETLQLLPNLVELLLLEAFPL